jgi:hypothetical protein
MQQEQQQQQWRQEDVGSGPYESTAVLGARAAPQEPTGTLAPRTTAQAAAADAAAPPALQGRSEPSYTFLTGPGSPLRLGAAVAPPPVLDDAQAAVVGAAQGSMLLREPCDPCTASVAAAGVQPGSAAQVAGSTGVHTQQPCASADASSKLLCYAHSAAGGAATPPPAAAAAAGSQRGHTPGREGTVPAATGAFTSSAGGTPGNWEPRSQQWPCNNSGSSGVQRPLSPFQQLGSPTRRPGSPHWSPVPPRTQLQSPVVVRPM